MKVPQVLTGLLVTSIARNGKAFARVPGAAVRPVLKPFFGRELDDVFSIFDEMDSIVPRTFDRRSFGRSLATDFKETKDHYELIVDLPGIDPKDIDIKLRGNDLTISAHRESHKKEDGANFHRVERTSGHVTRTFSLHVTIKKTAEEHPHERKIEVKIDPNSNGGGKLES